MKKHANHLLSSIFLVKHLKHRYLIPVFQRNEIHDQKDLPDVPLKDKSEKLGDELECFWRCYQENNKTWSLHLALLKKFGLSFFCAGILITCKEIIRIVLIPYLIGKLLKFFSQSQTGQEISKMEAYYFSAFLVAFLIIDRIISHPVTLWNNRIGMKIRVACSSLIYRKILKLDKNAIEATSVGHVVNLITNDLGRFDDDFNLIYYIWISPMQAIIVVLYLYMQLGWTCMFGVAFLIALLPVQLLVANKTTKLRHQTSWMTDERLRLMHNLVNGILSIKMHCLESKFSKLINKVRINEIYFIKLRRILWALTDFKLYASRTALYISLICYHVTGGKITTDLIFTLVAIYDVARHALSAQFAGAVRSFTETHLALLRVNTFLQKTELPERMFALNMQPARINLTNATAKFGLNGITLDIFKPQLFGVIGPVGSGKSTLLNVLLNEQPILGGELNVQGTISYASQEPWLFEDTIRKNIIFNEKYDKDRYIHVCKLCALEIDFDQLAQGDQTLIAERGQNLSGGQIARINLARCLYKEADIYLLDDPLSAVDNTVRNQLISSIKHLCASGKICIMATHQLQYLQYVDRIILLDKGKIKAEGTYKQVENCSFVKHLSEIQVSQDDISRQTEQNPDIYKKKNPSNSDAEKMLKLKQIRSKFNGFETYRKYFSSGGNHFVLFCLILTYFLFELISRSNDYYLTHITKTINSNENEEQTETRTLLYNYTILSVATIFFAIFHQLFFFTVTRKASLNIHNFIFSKLISAKLKIFTNNPSGHILNIFTKDLAIVDEHLPFVMSEFMSIAMSLAGTLVLTTFVNPFFLPVVVVLLYLFYLLRVIYIRTSKKLKYLEANLRSPLLNKVVSTLHGLSTIRAFSAEDNLIKEYNVLQDRHSLMFYLSLATTRAFGYWLDLLCVLFLSLVIFVLLTIQTDMNGGELGLLITQFMRLIGLVQYGMRQWTEVENDMISVERILEFSEQMKTEVTTERKHLIVKDAWPQRGKLEFRNVSMKYSEKDKPVLKSISFLINPGDKIGIVGRTGAGKSSLVMALLQLYNTQGKIFIDNVDISKVPLSILRSKISTIPQEPVLLKETLREHLDPMNEYTDKALWTVLEHVELKRLVSQMPQKLLSVLQAGNLSTGQKQLLCLAQALLTNNRILVLDEATANVDPFTDALIRKTIRKQFAYCTVLTIAHRLSTVIDSDKILVIDDGQIVDFNTHENLLKQHGGRKKFKEE